jgi:hypothetical protein
MVVMGMIIGRSLTAQLLEDIAAVRRREKVRRSDDNSCRKVQNVLENTSLSPSWICPLPRPLIQLVCSNRTSVGYSVPWFSVNEGSATCSSRAGSS